MDGLDKLSIYVPDSAATAIERDARLFEVFRSDGRTINRNRILSLILLGYSDSFTSERSRLTEAIASELSVSIQDEATRIRLARKIAGRGADPAPSRHRGTRMRRLVIKPTKETEGVLRTALDMLGEDESVSHFFCAMLMSYLSKSSGERESIVYRERVRLLQSACESGKQIAFTTTWDKEHVHKVTPFAMALGLDEQFNYLLCYEEANERRKALAYRLSRVSQPVMLSEEHTIPGDVKRHLSRMLKSGPQFAINDDEESCVRLTPKGAIAFQRIYQGRPTPKRIEEGANGDLYHFTCSQDQLFLYFRKFGAGEAEVISPLSLRERIVSFHEGALAMYLEANRA